jgi:ABC-type branched-subunit amino acid transport system substrate-binding protein
MRNRFKSVINVGATIALLGLSACGGGGAGTPSTAASGTPIKVMTIAPINVPVGAGLAFPEIGVAAQAAADAINRAGGIKGHPIQLSVCDSKFNENQDAACARQAVVEGDVALVGGISVQTSHISTIEQAGIPSIGEYPAAVASLNSPVVFPFLGGENSYGCVAELADIAKAKRVAEIHVNTPIGADPRVKATIEATLAKRGAQLVNYTLFTPAPDLTSVVVGALKDNPDGIAIFAGTSDTDKLTQLVRKFGPNVALARSSMAPSSLQTLGPLAENVYVCDPLKPVSLTNDPNVRMFVDQMSHSTSQVPVGSFAANAWAAMHVFAQVASTQDSVTSANLLTAMSKAKVDTLLGPTIDFTKTVRPELGYRHIYNFTWLYDQVRKGVVVNINNGKFVDPLA